MADLSVGTEALNSDANVWEDAARALKPPQNAAASMHLTAEDVMCYAARKGLDRQYNGSREKLLDMMTQAIENFYNVGFTLRATAITYEQSEANRAQNLRGAGEN